MKQVAWDKLGNQTLTVQKGKITEQTVQTVPHLTRDTHLMQQFIYYYKQLCANSEG